MTKPWMIIDIETLGTGLQAPIMAVAVVTSTGKTLARRLNIMQQIDKGAECTQDAIEFWLDQQPAKWLKYKYLTSPVFLQREINTMALGCDVWTRGNDFDIPILGNYFRRLGVASDRGWHAWAYQDLHNIRTAEMMTGPNPEARHSHDPIEDCMDDSWIIERYYQIVEQCQGMEIVTNTEVTGGRTG